MIEHSSLIMISSILSCTAIHTFLAGKWRNKHCQITPITIFSILDCQLQSQSLVMDYSLYASYKIAYSWMNPSQMQKKYQLISWEWKWEKIPLLLYSEQRLIWICKQYGERSLPFLCHLNFVPPALWPPRFSQQFYHLWQILPRTGWCRNHYVSHLKRFKQ